MQVETPTQRGDKFATAFAIVEDNPSNLPAPQATMSALMLSGNGMERAFRFAEMMATGMVAVPQHLKGNPADCLAVVIQALQWDMNPYAVAQKSHVTKGGQLGYEGQLIASVVAARAPIVGLPNYTHFGDWSKVRGKFEKKKGNNGGDYLSPTYTAEDEKGLGVSVSVLMKGETEPRTLDVYMDQCQPRFSTQWASDPEQQICYAAIRKWARRHTPNVILGVYADDEMEPSVARNMGAADVVQPHGAAAAPAQAHPKQAAADAAARAGKAAYSAFWGGLEKTDRLQLAPGHEARKAIAIAADEARTVDDTKPTTGADAQTAAPGISAAMLKERMEAARAANDGDALGEVADLIGVIANEAERNELEALYETILGELP